MGINFSWIIIAGSIYWTLMQEFISVHILIVLEDRLIRVYFEAFWGRFFGKISNISF